VQSVRPCSHVTPHPCGHAAAPPELRALHTGVRACADLRDNYNPGHKYSQWELKGACVRLELGPKDMEKQSVMAVRRDTGEREPVAWAALAQRLPQMLDEMQAAMFDAARAKVAAARVTVRPMHAAALPAPPLARFSARHNTPAPCRRAPAAATARMHGGHFPCMRPCMHAGGGCSGALCATAHCARVPLLQSYALATIQACAAV
jgi:Anticodon binding domain